VNGNQRWRERKTFFRRPDEQIRPSEYDVARLADDRLTKPFVLQHHYAAVYVAARFRFGLFRQGKLVGVAVFSHPVNDRTLTGVFGGRATESVELGRFVLLDEVPANGETFFLGHCLRALKKLGLRGVVSFSDPVPRTMACGEAVFPGHIGTIYQAANATYLGRGTTRLLHVLPDSSVLNERAISKIRTDEEGRAYAVRRLVEFGADDPAETVGWLHETYRDWLNEWLPRLTRRLRHPGNLKYAFALDRNAGPLKGLAYPKWSRGLDDQTGRGCWRSR
jgi:hypothetical protein